MTEDGGPKDYTAIPLVPHRVVQVGEAIHDLAVQGSIRTITDQYRPEYNFVLYWSFKATLSAARDLQQKLGNDVSKY